mgnify:CR=1 FL=1
MAIPKQGKKEMSEVKSKYDLEAAKKMFMDFKPLKQISSTLGIKYRTLVYHKSKWEEERNLVRKEILRDLSDNKRAILVSLTSNSLDCVDRAIEDLKKRDKPPSIHEARLLTNIVSEIDRIIRLDDGEPTDIISEHKPSTVIELKAKLKKLKYKFSDYTSNEISNDHLRHMVGGRGGQSNISEKNERIFNGEFPEKPGALLEFLESFGNHWNISLFHYRNIGSAYGNILIGIEDTHKNKSALLKHLHKCGTAFKEESNNKAYLDFLK